VHEVEGRGRHAFALFQAVRHPGPLLWILPAPFPHLPMPRALPEDVARRLILIRPGGGADLLRAVEDCLRSGAAGLVIAEPDESLSLTAGRRLQLAAEAGGKATRCRETVRTRLPIAGTSGRTKGECVERGS